MPHKNNTKQNNLISLNELDIQRIEDISKHIITKSNNLFDELNKQIIDRMNKDREDAQYSKEQVLQLRANNNSRLYKTPEDVNIINPCGRIWENGKVGYFIPFEHRNMGYDFMQPQFGGGQKDGKGLRFVQVHKDHKPYACIQSNDIIISGFGENVLGNWGKDLSKLFNEYTTTNYEKRVKQWRKDNYPNKMSKQMVLQLFNELKKTEQNKWAKATISEFFTTNDNEKLNQCMNEYFKWVDNCIQIENDKQEKNLIGFIKSGTISNSWVNGKAGYFNDFDNNCLYRFCEIDENCNHFLQNEQEQRNLPVLACGFVAWLIKHWGTDTQTIYSGYLQAKLNQYEAEHKNDADVFKRDLKHEFYDQYRAKEQQWVEQSEAIFDFISNSGVNQIKSYVKYYFEYADTQIPQPKTAEQPKSNANKVNTVKPQRTINRENLKDYFKSAFKGMGNGSINYFESMIEDLKTDRSAKEFAQIAYLIYESSHLNDRKPATFAEWHKIFCESIGIKQGKGYKPNHLKNPRDGIKNLFNYL
ncbi:MAG: hypothetical protein LBE12_19935 [Planctomycetaceae bacterium]|nr:hypothetical protein [Planctomycetaceae bacterium]